LRACGAVADQGAERVGSDWYHYARVFCSCEANPSVSSIRRVGVRVVGVVCAPI
jgi:hypothetical protein